MVLLGVCGPEVASLAGHGFGWGRDESGQVSQFPAKVDWVQVAAGGAHGLGIDGEGKVFGWGANDLGQATPPANLGPVIHVAAGLLHSLAVDALGRVHAWGDGASGQTHVPEGLTHIVQVAAGRFHSLALSRDGHVTAWGDNRYSQASVPTDLPPVKAIAAGTDHSLAVTLDGKIVVWGLQAENAHQPPALLPPVRTVAAGGHHQLALLENGTVIGWGHPVDGLDSVPEGLTNVVGIAAGHNHGLAWTQDGQLVAWGQGAGLALDRGILTGHVLSAAAGPGWSLALTPAPVFIQQPADAVLIEGETLLLSSEARGQPPLHYQWEKDGIDLAGATQPALSLDGSDPNVRGSYRVRVRNAEGEMRSRAASVHMAPRFLAMPASTIVLHQDQVRLIAVVSGSEPMHFQWWRGETPIPDATAPVWEWNANSLDLAGEYRLVVSNAWGTVSSDRIRVEIDPLPQLPNWTLYPSLVGYGGRVDFGATGDLSKVPHVRWTFNGMDAPGLPLDATIRRARPSHSGLYRLVASTRARDYDTGELTIEVAPATFMDHVGRAIVLDAGDGHGTVRGFQWFHQGREIQGATHSELVLDPLSMEDAGSYSVRLQEEMGERQVEVALVSVLPAPVMGKWMPLFHCRLGGPLIHELDNVLAISSWFANGFAAHFADGSFQVMNAGEIREPPRSPVERVVSHATGYETGHYPQLFMDGYWGAINWFGAVRQPGSGPSGWPVIKAIAHSERWTLYLYADGTLGVPDNTPHELHPPSGLTGVKAIAVGDRHGMALREDGQLVTWGETDAPGWTAQPRTGVRTIGAGREHSLVLYENGQVEAWGDNSRGQCQVPAGLTDARAILAMAWGSYAVDGEGRIRNWGLTYPDENGFTGVQDIRSLGGECVFAVFGSTNAPVILNQPLPQEVERGHPATFSVKAWAPIPLRYQWLKNGAPLSGATHATLVLPSVTLEDEGQFQVIVSTDAGSQTSLAAQLRVPGDPNLQRPTQRGQVVAWSLIGDSQPWLIPDLPPVVDILGPTDHQVLLTVTGDLIHLNTAQLTTSSTIAPPPDRVVDVQRYNGRYVYLIDNGDIRVQRADADELLPSGYRWLEELREVRKLSSSSSSQRFIALMRNGTVRSRSNIYRPFPDDLTDVQHVVAGDHHLAAVHADGRVVSVYHFPSEGRIPAPATLSGVLAMSAGIEHVMALLADGRVETWGSWETPETPIPPSGLKGVKVLKAVQYGALAILEDHRVAAWGWSYWHKLNPAPKVTNAIQLGCQGSFGLALVVGPWIEESLMDREVTLGETVRFEVHARAPGPMKYQWFFEKKPIPGATDSTLDLPSVTTDQLGLYEIEVESEGWTVRSQAHLTTSPVPEWNSHLGEHTVHEGDPFVWSITPWASELRDVEWRFEGHPLPSGHNPEWLLPAAAVTNSGTYQVVARSHRGHRLEATGVLNVVARRPMGRLRTWGNAAPSVPDVTGVIAVAAGVEHAVALRADGTVVAWGENRHGQLQVPPDLRGVVAIAAGNYHSLALRHNGSIVGWGENGMGELIPKSTGPFIQVAAADYFSHYNLGVLEGGRVEFWGIAYAPVYHIPESAYPAIRVAAGMNHAWALRPDGVAIGWGANDHLQTTIPAGWTPPFQGIAAGGDHSALWKADGSIVAFGLNDVGQTNLPPNLGKVVDLRLSRWNTLALLSDGTVRGWGRPDLSTIPSDLSNVIAVAGGLEFQVAVEEEDWFVVSLPESKEVLAGTELNLHCHVLSQSDLSFAWSKDGQPLSADRASRLIRSPVRETDAGLYQVEIRHPEGHLLVATADIVVRRPPQWIRVPESPIVWETMPIRLEGDVTGESPLSYQWSQDNQPLPAQTNRYVELTATSMSDAGRWTLVVSNALGSIQETVTLTVLPLPPAQITVLTGDPWSLHLQGASTADLTWQWFLDDRLLDGFTGPQLDLVPGPTVGGSLRYVGRSGDGTTIEGTTEVRVVTRAPRVDAIQGSSSVMLDGSLELTALTTGESPLRFQWYYQGLPIPDATQSVFHKGPLDALDAGNYTVEVSNDLGSVHTEPIAVGIHRPPNVVAWGTNVLGVLEVPLHLTNAVALSTTEHGLALTADGRVVAWGANTFGQATVPSNLPPAQAVAAGGEHSLVLLHDGSVVAWGRSQSGQSEVPANLGLVSHIAAGTAHSLALLTNGQVVGWGSSSMGETTPPPSLGPLPYQDRAASLAAGGRSSLALLTDGRVRTWGSPMYPPWTLSNVIALAVGPSRALARKSNGTLIGWTPTSGSQSENFEGPLNAVSFDSGLWIRTEGRFPVSASHQVASLRDGSVTTWGDLATTLFAPPPSLRHVTRVAAGRWHNLALIQAPVLRVHPRGGLFAPGSNVTLSIQVEHDEPHQIQWEHNGVPIPGANGPILNLPSLQAMQSGSYRANIQGASSHTVVSREAIVRADTLEPVITIQPRDASPALGQRTQFQIEAVGREPLSYAWYHNGRWLPQATHASLILESMNLEAIGLYEVRVSNPFGSVLSDSAMLGLGQNELVFHGGVPGGTAQGTWTMIQNGSPLTFVLQGGSGMGYVTWQTHLPRRGLWKAEVLPISPGLSPVGPTMTLEIEHGNSLHRTWITPIRALPGMFSPAQWMEIGTYSFPDATDVILRLRDTSGRPNQQLGVQEVRWTYLPDPPRIVDHPADQIVSVGEQSTFHFQATGVEPMTYSWFHNGLPLPGPGHPTLVLMEATANQGGTYQALVQNLDGAARTFPAHLTVNHPGLRFSWKQEGPVLSLEWNTDTAVLQRAGSIEGPYLDLPQAHPPHAVNTDASATSEFYRLRPGQP
jgi:alpha-tubulin suppressor-like RCC1 family protein